MFAYCPFMCMSVELRKLLFICVKFNRLSLCLIRMHHIINIEQKRQRLFASEKNRFQAGTASAILFCLKLSGTELLTTLKRLLKSRL